MDAQAVVKFKPRLHGAEYSPEERALVKAIFLTEDTQWEVEQRLASIFGDKPPSWAIIQNWIANTEIQPSQTYMAHFVKVTNGRVAAMIDGLLAPMYERVKEKVNDPECPSRELLNEIKSFALLAGQIRPTDMQGRPAQIFTGPVDARIVNFPFGPIADPAGGGGSFDVQEAQLQLSASGAQEQAEAE